MIEVTGSSELTKAAAEAAKNANLNEMIFFSCPLCGKIAACVVGSNDVIVAKCGYCRKKSAGLMNYFRERDRQGVIT